MTSDNTEPNLPFWPFLLVDALFLGLAAWVFNSAHRPLLAWEAWFLAVCVAAGGWSLVTPFLRRKADNQAWSQAQMLADAVSQIQKLEALAGQISNATGQWQGVQEHATATANTAKELAESMAAEAKSFTEFLQKTDQSEKAHLRLEADKLRRSEGEWLQIVTRILDHVFAVFQAASRSGQPNLVQQMTQFQDACRDTARRVGLVAAISQPGDAFDPNLHQLMDDAAAPEKAVIADTLATGYLYQGQLIRRSLVTLQP